MPVVIESVAERLAKEAQREVDEYQRSLLEGDKQETGEGSEENPAVVTSPSKIVFKRSHDDLGDSDEAINNAKMAKTAAGQSLTVNSTQNSIGPQALPKPPQSDPAPPPDPESSSVPKYGYDWGRGAHRGGPQGRGRGGSSGAGTRPGDWPCSACGNYNFAWRSTCNQCAQPKQANTMPVAYPGWGYNPGYGANYGNGYG